MRLWTVLIPLICSFALSAQAADPAAATLTLTLPDGVHTWTTGQLLTHPKARQVQVTEDVSYKRPMTYRAVPMAALLTGVTADEHVQAVATDGFAAEIPAAPLLQQTGAQAWLAIEDPANPWPKLGDGDHSAGPFYLVWTKPEASNIGPEEWPYAMASVKVLESVAKRFPAMLPDPKLAANDPINQGFAVFQKSCLACHRLNGGGDSQLGPDLNLPHSPTEYFAGDYFKRYIRDPQSLRSWPQAKMPAISTSALSDGDLDLLMGYLKHMAQRRGAE
jgi:mono/diheme cytochrome c family protein